MCVFNKRGLSYQPKNNLKVFKNYFVKAEQSYDLNHKCNYCRSIGYIIYACLIKKYKVCNMTWVPKGSTSNNKRLKKIWVPKGLS